MSKNVIRKTLTTTSVYAFVADENGMPVRLKVCDVHENLTESAARTLVKRATGDKNAGVVRETHKKTYEIDASVFFEYAREVAEADA